MAETSNVADDASDTEPQTPCWRNGVNRSNKRWGVWQYIDRKFFNNYYSKCLDICLPDEWILSPAEFTLPPPPHIRLFDVQFFRTKLSAIYTHSDPSKLHLFFPHIPPGYIRDPPNQNLFDAIYKTFLPGPKNLSLMRSRGLFPVGRINFQGNRDSKFEYHIPTEKFAVPELAKWHRQFASQLKTRMSSPLTPEEKAQEDPSLVSIFESSTGLKESFEKVFIFVDRMECWNDAGVLLIEMLSGSGTNVIESLVGNEGAEVTKQLGGDSPGSEWRAWRVKIEKAIQVVMALQPEEDWTAVRNENDLVVECGWKDREENGTGKPVEYIN